MSSKAQTAALEGSRRGAHPGAAPTHRPPPLPRPRRRGHPRPADTARLPRRPARSRGAGDCRFRDV